VDTQDRYIYRLIKFLIKNGADVTANNNITLVRCCGQCLTTCIKLLLDNGANLHVDNDKPIAFVGELIKPEQTQSKTNIIYYNTIYYNTIKLLLQYGADVSAHTNKVLLNSIYRRCPNVIQLLIDHGATLYECNIYSYQSDIDTIKLLLNYNISITHIINILMHYQDQCQDILPSTLHPCYSQFVYNGHSQVEVNKHFADLFNDYIINDNISAITKILSEKSNSFKSYVRKYMNIDTLKFLMDRFPDYFQVIILDCINAGEYMFVEYILNNYSINQKILNEILQLSYDYQYIFCYTGFRIKIINLLIKHGAQLDPKCIAVVSYKHEYFIESGLLRCFIDNGADVTYDNNFALRCYASRCETDKVKMLLENGADVHAYNDEAIRHCGLNHHIDIGYSDVNTTQTYIETIQSLLQYGANASANNSEILLYNINKKYIAVIKLLIRYGADINQVSNYEIKLSKNDIETIDLVLNSNLHADPVLIISILLRVAKY